MSKRGLLKHFKNLDSLVNGLLKEFEMLLPSVPKTFSFKGLLEACVWPLKAFEQPLQGLQKDLSRRLEGRSKTFTGLWKAI